MKKWSLVSGGIAPLGVLLVFAYLLASLWQNQSAINAKRAELAAMQARLAEQEALNQELNRALSDDLDAIIERIAREQGYAQPNERIFIGY